MRGGRGALRGPFASAVGDFIVVTVRPLRTVIIIVVVMYRRGPDALVVAAAVDVPFLGGCGSSAVVGGRDGVVDEDFPHFTLHASGALAFSLAKAAIHLPCTPRSAALAGQTGRASEARGPGPLHPDTCDDPAFGCPQYLLSGGISPPSLTRAPLPAARKSMHGATCGCCTALMAVTSCARAPRRGGACVDSFTTRRYHPRVCSSRLPTTGRSVVPPRLRHHC